jgi:hypothetical protein
VKKSSVGMKDSGKGRDFQVRRRKTKEFAMTIETGTIETPKKGVLTRGKGFLKVLALLLLVGAICAWIGLGIGLYLDVDRGARITLAIVAAVTTEALFWTTAALLGMSVVEARKRIWRKITGRGTPEAAPPAVPPQP